MLCSLLFSHSTKKRDTPLLHAKDAQLRRLSTGKSWHDRSGSCDLAARPRIQLRARFPPPREIRLPVFRDPEKSGCPSSVTQRNPAGRQQQLQSGFGVARTVGLFAHCPSSKAKGGARCQVQYAASSNFNRASESLGQSDYSPTVLAAELRGELGAKSNMPPAATSIGLRSRSDSRIIRPLS